MAKQASFVKTPDESELIAENETRIQPEPHVLLIHQSSSLTVPAEAGIQAVSNTCPGSERNFFL